MNSKLARDSVYRVIWVRHGTELQLEYLQLAMLFTASKNEVEPVIEKHSRQESLWRGL